ncbi:MAG: PIN domain protein [Gemmatimonadetes bacterium]|nr:PIN domain protein [Gemmatimonadota bacterium]
MPVARIYLDTSVIGGCFDREFATWSRALVEDFRAQRFRPVVSDLVAAELAMAPPMVRELFNELLGLADPPLTTTPEVVELAGRYASHGVLPARFQNDLLHIALASVANTDILVSWNFRHIVRFDKIRVFNAVNLEAGYKAIAIHSPREVATYGLEAE